MALFAVGDVHGCVRTLEVLLDRLSPSAADHLVFVGDYVDRGPRSRETIDLLLELERAADRGTGPRCTFLRGNHDQMMLDWVNHGEIDLWTTNGGLTTLASYSQPGEPVSIPEEHLDFLRRTRMTYSQGPYFFVHAGLNPELTIEENLRHETAETFLWTRGHLQARRNWEQVVVCGHTPQREVLVESNLIIVDTGCCFPHHPGLGRLSAIELPDGVVTSVQNAEEDR